MSGHPPRGGYDDVYGQQGGADSYYQDEHNQAYYDQQGYPEQQGMHQHGADGYYDESCAFIRTYTIIYDN